MEHLARSALLFTERPGEEPGIVAERLPRHFGRARDELLQRMGGATDLSAPAVTGHDAPLLQPNATVPFIEYVLGCAESACDQHALPGSH